MIVTVEIIDQEFEVEFSYRVTAKGRPARTYGPPEDCYPAEPMEWEIDGAIVLREQQVINLKTGRITGGATLDTPKWLYDALEEYLASNSDVDHAVLADYVDAIGDR